MAEAIVSLAIERISDLLIHEAVFLRGVREDVERLRAELERMQSFLKDADQKQEQDERFRNRVVKITDLAYDAEDVIETFILKVAHQGGFQGVIKRFTSIFTKPFHLYKIGVQAKAIQTKLQDISKNLPAYEIPGEREGSSYDSGMMLQWSRRTYSHAEEEDPVSLEDLTKTVLAQLMKEEDRPHVVVSIVGMGGIGKTTLAKKVYNHIEVKRHFDCFAWAFVSQNWMPREVLHGVLAKVLSSKGERKEIDKLTGDELVKRVFEVLKEKRYLVVLDDIWRSEHWDSLKPAFPRGKKGSKILFTTRNKNVALFADPFNSPIELSPLTDEESWELFSRKAFSRIKAESQACSKEFETLGREMVGKCAGLPLAIVVLRGLLATKDSLAEWEMVQRNFHVQQHGAVDGILVLSYNDLPYHLKPCFLYLGHYPEDWKISKKELIQLWIAEGFISPTLEGRGMLLEDVAERFLGELINRCLVQVGEKDETGMGVKTCQIHDLWRDLCVKKAQEEHFLEIIRPSLIENHDLILDETSSACRRIAIHPSKTHFCLKVKRSNLRSLLLFQNEKLIYLPISKCKNFKFLRVLKVVRGNNVKWRVSSEIGNLRHLRYLELKNHGEIILPQSVKKLKNLHTLKIESHGFIRTPKVLFELERLRHIELVSHVTVMSGRCFCSPHRFASKNIESLWHIGVENLVENNAMLRLTNIQSLGIIFVRSKDVEPIVKALMKLHRLQSLHMTLANGSFLSYPDLEPLSQFGHLLNLSLVGKIQEDPRHHVLKFVPLKIVRLTLWKSEVEQDPMPVLEKLPELRILRLLGNSYRATKLICTVNGFPKLDSLRIHCLSELEEWEIEEGAMPRLRALYLSNLSNLRMFPEGLRYVTALQEMKLHGMKRSLVERIEVIDGREGEDISKVSHIPSIQIFHTRNH